MRLLFLGYSSIAERRVIRAAAKVTTIAEISIASKSREPLAACWPKRGSFFKKYSTAIEQSGADTVYISLPNALHAEWVSASLAAGKHVIVDKPALLSLSESRQAVAQARRAGLLLAEATVFTYHPQTAALHAFLHEYGPLTHADAQFIIPPLPMINFRNHSELGGGCLLDMGPYAAALIRVFGGGSAKDLYAIAGGQHPQTGIDMGFSLLARLANGALFSGHFSFEGEYQNRLILVGCHGSVIVNRVFSLPPLKEVVWNRRIRNSEELVKLPAADAFEFFLADVNRAIDVHMFDPFYSALLADAEMRERLLCAVGRL